jgi:alanine-alpha-ketoisovalerate/valine-pyruvate aminotransferase
MQTWSDTRRPLSPLLFVSTAEILQYAINDVWQNGIINLPIDNDFGKKFPIIKYADDTLLIMPACTAQLAESKL